MNSLRCDLKVDNERQGSLFVVATPIGNMEDITLRAIKILAFVDLVVAEDTRLTARLLSYHGIKTRFLSMYEHNEVARISEILDKINSNMNVALVSSAGTPLISDPGFRLLIEAIRRSINIVPIPGVSAVIASISVAGLPTDAFIFLGFPSRKKGKRLEHLRQLSFENKTLVFYESPRRIIAFLSEIVEILGNRKVVLSREMTKMHEEFLRGKALNVLAKLRNKNGVRGECTLLISGDGISNNANIRAAALNKIRKYLKCVDFCTSDLSKIIAEEYDLPKNEIYSMVLEVKKDL